MPTSSSSQHPAHRTETATTTATRAGRSVGATRGTALMLVPAAMLVFFVLGSISIDLTAIFLAQRSAQRSVSAAADDAAGMLDTRLIQYNGDLLIDIAAANRVARAHIASRVPSASLRGPVIVKVSADRKSIEVRITVRVPHIMMKALPGRTDYEDVTVTSAGRILK